MSSSSPPPRRPAPAFRPSFTLSMLYVVGFFFLYIVALVLPELIQVVAQVEPGPEQERIAEQIAREAARPRLLVALVLSLVTVGAGAYYQLLPGLRR